jgi:DNA-binding NarL/FixJ family response regulator
MPPATEARGEADLPGPVPEPEGEREVRRILLVDDHPLVADGLRVLVEGLEPATALLWTGTLQEGFELLDRDPDIALVLLDLRLPGFSGYSALDRFRHERPEMPVAVLSGSTDRALILGSLERGARGFIPKTANRDETARALARVAAGEIYVPTQAMGGDPGHPGEPRDPHVDELEEAAALAGAAIERMTPRQREVLRLLVHGRSNRLIARELGLSDNTVKIHVSAVLRAIGAANRAQAVFIVSRAGGII